MRLIVFDKKSLWIHQSGIYLHNDFKFHVCVGRPVPPRFVVSTTLSSRRVPAKRETNLKYYFNFHVCLSITFIRDVISPADKFSPYAPPVELDSTRTAGTF